jgi:hypothetical protein
MSLEYGSASCTSRSRPVSVLPSSVLRGWRDAAFLQIFRFKRREQANLGALVDGHTSSTPDSRREERAIYSALRDCRAAALPHLSVGSDWSVLGRGLGGKVFRFTS